MNAGLKAMGSGVARLRVMSTHEGDHRTYALTNAERARGGTCSGLLSTLTKRVSARSVLDHITDDVLQAIQLDAAREPYKWPLGAPGSTRGAPLYSESGTRRTPGPSRSGLGPRRCGSSSDRQR